MTNFKVNSAVFEHGFYLTKFSEENLSKWQAWTWHKL